MKVLALVILAVASAAGKGSGPYLPSGWRPEGPSFYLPSELQPSKNVKNIILAGSEASGSDSLREYGPPKVVDLSQNLINQGLPDAVTEQSFYTVPLIVEIVKEAATEAVDNTEAKTEQTVEQSEAATESVLKADVAFDQPIAVVESEVESTQASLANEKASDANVELSQKSLEKSSKSESSSTQESSTSYQSSSSQESSSFLSSSSSQSSSSQESSSLTQSASSHQSSSNVEAISGQVSQESLTNEQSTEFQSDVTEKSETQENSDSTLGQVQNIPDIIASFENGNKAQEAEEATNEQTASTAAPEGFLEYGPPGFAEYGPPKGELSQDANEEAGDQSFENTNETRRRRFSPKFKSSKKN